MNWTPNDIVLSVEAYARWVETPAHEAEIVRQLADETGRNDAAARTAMQAVGNIDPAAGKGPKLTPFAEVIARHLWGDRRELTRLASVIRERR